MVIIAPGLFDSRNQNSRRPSVDKLGTRNLTLERRRDCVIRALYAFKRSTATLHNVMGATVADLGRCNSDGTILAIAVAALRQAHVAGVENNCASVMQHLALTPDSINQAFGGPLNGRTITGPEAGRRLCGVLNCLR